MATTGWARGLTVTTAAADETAVLYGRGILDRSSYLSLRDKIIETALEEPAAVVVDVTDLAVPADDAWLAFTSARWHIDRWPNVPLALACELPAGRAAIARSGVGRLVRVFDSVDAAVHTLPRAATHRRRHRARAVLRPVPPSLRRARQLLTEWLSAWSQTDLLPGAKIIATTFVENVLQHTDSHPRLRLETDGRTVAVAVADSSRAPAVIREVATRRDIASGLRIVSALCRTWGSAPTPGGKTVWAVIGPENRL